MLLADLTAYAAEQYHMEEQHKWEDFPGFSVLADPATGRWIALLMRQWDSESGEEIERCDLKCGRQTLFEYNYSFLAPPIRMKGNKWISISFGKSTEPEVVFRLFDRAVSSGDQRGFTFVLDHSRTDAAYHETPLPFSGSSYRPESPEIPAILRQMKQLYEYGRETPEARAKNFYRQGMLMKDYEDDVPWTGNFVCYFPTYHDLNTRQLRGYFTWRSRFRRGEVTRIPASAAYIYVYELLNGIGTDSPEESLQELSEFEKCYLNGEAEDERMRENLHRWMTDLAVMHGLSPDLVKQYAGQEEFLRSSFLAALQAPERHTDEEIFRALCFFGYKKLPSSPVLSRDPDRGIHLFAEIWRKAGPAVLSGGETLFTRCFGSRALRPWRPMANAVFYPRVRPEEGEYHLDETRSFCFRNGSWKQECFDKSAFDKDLFHSFLHESERKLRLYCKAGRPLSEKYGMKWTAFLIDGVIEEDRRAVEEAARPKIHLDLTVLDRIRQDALSTQDSLLTEEDLSELHEEAPAAAVISETPPAAPQPSGLPLDDFAMQILRALLRGEDVSAKLKEAHAMPSLLADEVNEALFDLFGDSVLECDDDKLSLVDDYTQELLELTGGHDQ